jgi:phosphopantothenoylcysteine decarboxylase/phosphopantothenate--cysteine ligase
MDYLCKRQVLLGITGGIAAYKSAELCRLLVTSGADVRVVMTRAATEFITPLTLQALSGRPVHLELLDTEAEAAMGHIELARWADLVLVAPATADFMARLAQGQADDLLTTLCLATDARIALAPAMNQAMWRDAATQDNVARLAGRGTVLLGPDSGSQACGDIGPGRMLEPQAILAMLGDRLPRGALAGRRVTITAGPTREAIDPVRYLSNHSSGKMGFAIADAAARAGAAVTLVAGPVALETPPRVERVDVVSARDMHREVMARIDRCDLFIAAAAVADYRPRLAAERKIKKEEQESLTLELERNPDILADVAARPDPPFTVGFAAETDDVAAHARRKLERKRLDMVIANDVSQPGIGFDSDYNAVIVLHDGVTRELPRTTKNKLAEQLVELIAQSCRSRGEPN